MHKICLKKPWLALSYVIQSRQSIIRLRQIVQGQLPTDSQHPWNEVLEFKAVHRLKYLDKWGDWGYRLQFEEVWLPVKSPLENRMELLDVLLEFMGDVGEEAIEYSQSGLHLLFIFWDTEFEDYLGDLGPAFFSFLVSVFIHLCEDHGGYVWDGITDKITDILILFSLQRTDQGILHICLILLAQILPNWLSVRNENRQVIPQNNHTQVSHSTNTAI